MGTTSSSEFSTTPAITSTTSPGQRPPKVSPPSIIQESEFPGPPSDKIWDWLSEIITPETQTKVDSLITSIEEVYYIKGSAEGQRVAQELTKSTGFILEYTLLDDKGAAAKSLAEEMKLNGYSLEMGRAAERAGEAKATKKLEYNDPEMKEDYLVALSLYTSSSCYTVINQALRATNSNLKTMLRHVNFAANFIKGFRLLPSYWGKVYRGAVLDPTEYKVGKIVLLKGFTSTSRSMKRAQWFAEKAGELVTDKLKKVLFEIESLSGRCLEDFSFYPGEQEVAFRPFTSFFVVSMNVVEEVYYIRLREAYPDIRGRKVLVWIDDKHAFESKLIMDKSERMGVTCVHLHSTKEAKAFCDRHPHLLLRDSGKLRIITDMVRVEEDGKQNIEAGLDVVRLLATQYNYRQPLMCFTGPKFLLLNREKFLHHGFKHVFATARRQEAELFAKFVPLPSNIVSPSSSSASSSSSSSSPSSFSSYTPSHTPSSFSLTSSTSISIISSSTSSASIPGSDLSSSLSSSFPSSTSSSEPMKLDE